MVKLTVAVTGATGVVGTSVVQQLVKHGYHVRALVHTAPPPGHPLYQSGVEVTSLDLANLPALATAHWLETARPIALIHAAALADVRRCEREPELAYHMNVNVTRMLARNCAQAKIHFILLSTEYVFSGTSHPTLLYCEDDAVNPLNTYGKSKAMSEKVTQEECINKTLWSICRTSVVYGSDSWHKPDFPTWLRKTLGRLETVQLASDQVNTPTYCHDLARMLVAVISQRLTGIYHLAGRTSIDRYTFCLSIARHYNLDPGLIFPTTTANLNEPVQRPLNAGLCVDKITRYLETPPLSLEEGLTAARQHEHSVEP